MPWTAQGPYVITGPFSAGNANNMELQYQEASLSIHSDILFPMVMNGFAAVKDGSISTQLDVALGVAWILQTDGTLRRRNSGALNYSTTGNPSTSMYLDLNPDGTWSWATTHSAVTNHLTIASVTTDASSNILTVTDLRPLFTSLLPNMTPGSSGSVVFVPSWLTAQQGSLVLNSKSSGAANGVYFGSWDGSAVHTPFSIGGQFGSALTWVDNSAAFHASGGYHDVAEEYATDREYEAGTVLCPSADGGGALTRCEHDNCHAAMLASSGGAFHIHEEEPAAEFVTPIALAGRIEANTADKSIRPRDLVVSDGRGGVRRATRGMASWSLGYALTAAKEGKVRVFVRASWCRPHSRERQ